MAPQAQSVGSVKDIQAHLRHSRPDTTAHDYMQTLPESVQAMVGSVYKMLTKARRENVIWRFATKYRKLFERFTCKLLI